MACFRPIRAYLDVQGGVSFVELRGNFVKTLELPCGGCIGCRLERSRQWAVRCVHEAKLHQDNCFVTLTYDDGHLPEGNSLRYRDFQLFMKRFRKAAGRPLRFYMCGEYGEALGRPHYHACIFGFDFSDKKLLSQNAGNRLYRSGLLESLWPYGMSSVGAVTFQSASYIARYIVDKITGDLADSHYEGRVPEFNRMSLKPGIGYGWFERYWKDWYPKGECVVDGKPGLTPKYYDKLLYRIDSDNFDAVKFAREQRARVRSWDNTDGRLKVRELVMSAGFQFKENK